MDLQPNEKQFKALKEKAHNFVNRSPQPCRLVLQSGLTRNDSARIQPTKTSDRETREGTDGGDTAGNEILCRG
jgi:uncharacterized cupin superfamily protein